MNTLLLRLTSAPLLALLCTGACKSDPPAPSQTAAALQPAAAEPAPAPEKTPEPSANEQLEKDWAALRASNEQEQARWTDEMREQTRSLAAEEYPTARAALQAALSGPHRQPGNAERDPQRHPLETLELFGFQPDQTVLEYGPGAGWYTEILAPALAARGKLLVTNGDPNGPKDQRSTYYAERLASFLKSSPEAYGKVESVLVTGEEPKLGRNGDVDLVLVIRGLHGMHNRGQLDAWLDQFHTALKPGGVLGIVQHRAPAGANPDESSKKGYLPESWVVERATAHGFVLETSSELNANPRDTKDYADGVWTLPPSYRLGDVDRAKYDAIGESDRMTLKLVKTS
jgi:predicted methyltransferase